MNFENQQLLEDAGVDVSTRKEMSPFVAMYVVPGGQSAVDLWHRLSKSAAELNGWPLLCGDIKDLHRLEETLGFATESPDATIARAPLTSPTLALAEDKVETRKRMLEHMRSINAPEIVIQNLKRQISDDNNTAEAFDLTTWPKEADRPRHPVTPFVLGRADRPLERCLLAVVATKEPAAAAAFMNFGGFNDCPGAEMHIAYFRDWHERFGAVPIAVTSDVVEMFVPSPPSIRETAFSLAVEQYAYAPDIVDQGTESVNALAAELWKSPY